MHGRYYASLYVTLENRNSFELSENATFRPDLRQPEKGGKICKIFNVLLRLKNYFQSCINYHL